MGDIYNAKSEQGTEHVTLQLRSFFKSLAAGFRPMYL